MNKLKEVTEKICELLKGGELDPMRVIERAWNSDIARPIREAELLMALSNAPIEHTYAIHEEGDFLAYDKGCNGWDYDNGTCWTLGKPLSEQPQETINFLHQILIN